MATGFSGFEKVPFGNTVGILRQLRNLIGWDGTTLTLKPTGGIVDGNGAPIPGLKLADSDTASGDADLTLGLGSEFLYLAAGRCYPASDALFEQRVAVGGTEQSGVADYAWRTLNIAASAASDTSDSEIQLTGAQNVESTASTGGVQFVSLIVDPAQTTIPCRILSFCMSQRDNGDVAVGYWTTGTYIGGLSAISHLIWFFPSVNMTGAAKVWSFGS